MPQEVSVVLVGCGCPLRSMGWYHATQLLDKRVPFAKLTAIVEPFYMLESLGKKFDETGYNTFQKWRKSTEESYGVKFYSSVEDLPPPSQGEHEHRLGIISSRTADNPKLFSGCIDAKCKTIFLEKPGAPTVAELEGMRDMSNAAGCKVFMGFNKNVSAYLERTRAYASQSNVKCDVTFLHNNAYPNTEQALSECFERNAEGMLKNMAIHELAILVTFYGVTVDSIAAVEADKEYSSCKTMKGPISSNNKEFTDFDKLKFKITTKDGVQVNVAADRCGGDDSVGIVTNADTHEELARYSMPDDDAIANIPNLEKRYSGAMPYFFTQDPDYLKLKQRVVRYCVGVNGDGDGDGDDPEGVASIDVAIETLRIAEYLTPILQRQLLQ